MKSEMLTSLQTYFTDDSVDTGSEVSKSWNYMFMTVMYIIMCINVDICSSS